MVCDGFSEWHIAQCRCTIVMIHSSLTPPESAATRFGDSASDATKKDRKDKRRSRHVVRDAPNHAFRHALRRSLPVIASPARAWRYCSTPTFVRPATPALVVRDGVVISNAHVSATAKPRTSIPLASVFA